jgi:hypothetical protein
VNVQEFIQGLFESALGVSNVRGGDAGAAMGEQPAEAVGPGQGIDEFGVDEILNRFA